MPQKPVSVEINSNGNGGYKHPLYFFDEPVFQKTMDSLSKNPPETNDVTKLMMSATMVNARFKKNIGYHVTYTTKEIEDSVLKAGYNLKIRGLIDNLELIACSEKCPQPNIAGISNKDFDLLTTAAYKAGDVPSKIKVVTVKEKCPFLEALRKAYDFQVQIIDIEQAAKEMEDINKALLADPQFNT